MTKSIKKALADYEACLQQIEELNLKHANTVARFNTIKTKIATWLRENAKDVQDIPKFLMVDDPALVWEIGLKNDGLATELHMLVDDEIIPKLEQESKEKIKPLKELTETIENWALAELLARGAKNFKTELGTASLRTDVKYQIADKALFIKAMQEKGAESEITVTVRPNSRVMAKILEEDGEYPAGLQASRFQKCVFVKS